MMEEESEDEWETGESGEANNAAEAPPGLVQLTFAESRVLGCLLEKEVTTPDHYPLTLNSLHSACNQSSNREPVTDLGTDTVEEAMEGLRYKKLAILVHQAGARVPKCKHTLENKFPYLTNGQRAILCVLLLRGQQTAGELRQRTERLHPFVDVERAQEVLDELANYEPCPLVRKIPAGGGRRVVTYVHLFCGGKENLARVGDELASADRAVTEVASTGSWREEMESEIASLRTELATLRSELDELKTNLGV